MLSKRGVAPTAPCQKILGMEQWGSWNVSMLADRLAGGQPSGAGRGELRAPCHSTGHPDSNPGGARPNPSVEYTPDPISASHLSLHTTSPSPSKGTHGAVLGGPLPAEVALHILRREKVTGTDRVGRRKERVTVGLGPVWVPPQLRSRCPSPRLKATLTGSAPGPE